MKSVLLFILLVIAAHVSGQIHILHGTVTNNRQEPLAFASIRVKEIRSGTITKEDGSYSIELEEGKYDFVITLVGYQPQVVTVIIGKGENVKNILLEISTASNLAEVIVKGKSKDRAEEFIRNVIRNKESIENAAGNYSCKIYIKALQEDSSSKKIKPHKTESDLAMSVKKDERIYNAMAMAEIILQLDHGAGKNIREERTGIKKRGNTQSLFFQSTTEGDFNFYNNLVNIPGISETPFVSPLSYSGLLAYRFKTIKIEDINGRKTYTVSVKPRQLSNATVEGEISIDAASWAIVHTRFQLPKYHLAEYDFFELEQQYLFINDTAWMMIRQEFNYNAATGKKRSSGHTIAIYSDFKLNEKFEKKHFGTEISSATKLAYERDSIFWQVNRAAPLTEKEVRFIHYKDSIFTATHTKAYLDSVDKVINKITWQNILYKGQNFNNHEKMRNWYVPALPSLYQPLQFGGTRILALFNYFKTYKSRKNISLYTDASYGLRNKDVNGSIRFSKLYNPFSRGTYSLRIQKNFEAIFLGDAWINLIKRSNIYLNQGLGFGHSLELKNGLFLFTDVDVAFRRSVSNYKTNSNVDSLFGSVLENNQAIAFPSYNALYGTLRLDYTPWQHYIREPREKIVLGSAWPTFYMLWKKGIPGILSSKVNFDYIEFGIRQTIKAGTLGTASYSIKTGSFYNQKDLRLVDYKYQRRGDPLLFLNPNEAFQSLDSTFPVFHRFYEAHFVHEFNGAFFNKIPLFKKIGLREIAGTGFLYVPERNNLRYAELFAGIERVFKYPFNNLGKFKIGMYVSGSSANQFHHPVQFKIGITTWDRRNGKWF